MANPASTHSGAGQRCVVCGGHNRPGLLICDICGSSLLAPDDQTKAPEKEASNGVQTTILFDRPPCPYCGHANSPAAPRCTHCGHQLALGVGLNALRARFAGQKAVSDREAGKVIAPAPLTSTVLTSEKQEADAFQPGMTLRLEMTGISTPLIIRPRPEMIMGRSDPSVSEVPDIDLTAYSGYRLGVSRRHAALRLEGQVLDIRDLGSSNGSFINGVRLAAYQPRRLRSGDIISLGNLDLNVRFVPDETRNRDSSLHQK